MFCLYVFYLHIFLKNTLFEVEKSTSFPLECSFNVIFRITVNFYAKLGLSD